MRRLSAEGAAGRGSERAGFKKQESGAGGRAHEVVESMRGMRQAFAVTDVRSVSVTRLPKSCRFQTKGQKMSTSPEKGLASMLFSLRRLRSIAQARACASEDRPCSSPCTDQDGTPIRAHHAHLSHRATGLLQSQIAAVAKFVAAATRTHAGDVLALHGDALPEAAHVLLVPRGH